MEISCEALIRATYSRFPNSGLWATRYLPRGFHKGHDRIRAGKVVENAIGSIVSSAVDGGLRNANIKVDETATTFVKAAVAETINRVIE